MAKSKRNHTQLVIDMSIIEEMHLKGKPSHEIASYLSNNRPYTITRQQIDYDLKKIEQRWSQSNLDKITKYKDTEIAKINLLCRTYWDAWERSCSDKQITNSEQSDGDAGTKRRAALKKENRDGNPAFLSGVQWCIEEICKIKGLHAPIKIKDVTELSDEELMAIAAMGRRTEEGQETELDK